MMPQEYALTNPISRLVDKPRPEYTREDLIRVIEAKNIERITFHYTGLDGKLKELKLPIANRNQADRILAEGERVDGSSLFKGLVDPALSDLYAVPVYKTAFLNPLDPYSLDFICRYMTSEGELAYFAGDTILLKAHDTFKKSTGLELFALGELEFFLIGKPETNIFPNPKQKGYHASAPFIKTSEILNEMVRYITQISGAVKYAHSEVGYVDSVRSNLDELKGKQAEQLEIEFLPTSVDDMGDHLVLSRWLIRNIAYKHKCVATFAPKLEEGIAGNGMHVHVGLMKDGKNIMIGKDKNLSGEAKKLIGGLCTYADSLTAFGNTVSSAYLRMVPNQEAPTRICWSDLNRSTMIRIPLGWAGINNLARRLNIQQDSDYHDAEGRQTVELRSPDGSAITYLLLAGITMAAEWGLTHPDSLATAEKLHVTGNIFKDEKLMSKLPALPKSCVESSKVLLKKRALYERNNIFPASVIEYVANLLNDENDEHMNKYLSDLPADDRLFKTRKIMHKDLHKH
ncbi:MAG: glutamine synthetase family protein [Candidatus Latescibacterota bacterium]